jgi:NAD(P)-dependent dehydrogenase (short-subunit alcohol dehydrogenase family)
VSRGPRWTVDDIPDLTGRRALVTGVTSGVGEAVVEALARKGAEVVMAARNEEKLAATVDEVRRDVPGASVRPLILDLSDLGSVRSAAEEASTYGPLNILVNNAGVMATPYERTVDGLELQMATNVFGHFALTGLLLPRLVEAGKEDGARVVAVASQGHRFARRAPLQDPNAEQGHYSKWRTYAQTKLSNLLFTMELDRRVRAAGLPIDAMAAHPGFAATGLMASGQRRNAAGRILDAAFGALGQAPSEGALPLLMAATADLPSTTYVGPSGPGEMRGAPKIVGTTKLARDPEDARRLWEIAQDVTGVGYP